MKRMYEPPGFSFKTGLPEIGDIKLDALNLEEALHQAAHLTTYFGGGELIVEIDGQSYVAEVLVMLPALTWGLKFFSMEEHAALLEHSSWTGWAL